MDISATLTKDFGNIFFTEIGASQLQKGDIIMFNPGTPGSTIGHMGIVETYDPVNKTGAFSVLNRQRDRVRLSVFFRLKQILGQLQIRRAKPKPFLQ
jgi:hypothetical protein